MPLISVSARDMSSGIFLERQYIEAFAWLQEQVSQTDVILASPDDVGVWVPAMVQSFVYYGHRTETRDAGQRRQAALQWYRSQSTEDCAESLLVPDENQNQLAISYVIYGPREQALGPAACLNRLQLVREFDDVAIYANQPVSISAVDLEP